MLTFFVFIIILSILVLVHEFGHFIVAKKNGIKVEEFGWGIPPKVFGKKIGETLYSINLLPFGGFVRLYGEEYTDATILKDKRSFAAKTPWQRFSVLIAGVTMNFILAATLYYIFFFFTGFKTFQMPLLFNNTFVFGTQHETSTVISGFLTDSHAKEDGILIGDAILQIDGQPITNVQDVRKAVTGKFNTELEVTVKDLFTDNATERVVKVTPMIDDAGNSILGVYLTRSVLISYDKPIDKLLSGFMHTYNILAYSVNSLATVISSSVESKDITPVSESVSGPVGIYSVVNSILNYGSERILLSLLDLTAMLSISLAFLNILPLPALDGGRLFFVLIEVVSRGKRLSHELEARIHSIGMAVLILLLVLVTIKDIVN